MLLRRRSPVTSLSAACVSIALVAGPAAAAEPTAATAEEPAAAQPTDPEPVARARALYEKGRDLFDTAEYGRAIDLWTEAYGVLPDTPEAAPIKAALIYNIATARERAYAIDDDVTHLRRAVILLEQYSGSIPALYGDGEAAQAERDKVQTRIETLEKEIDAARTQRPDADPDPDPDPVDDVEPDPDPIDDLPPDPRSRPFIISGAVLTGLGVAGLGLMAGGLVMGSQANDDVPADLDERRDQFDRGQTGNTLAYVGGALGGVLLVTGATLLGLGVKGRSGSISVAPAAGPRLTGLRWSGRF